MQFPKQNKFAETSAIDGLEFQRHVVCGGELSHLQLLLYHFPIFM